MKISHSQGAINTYVTGPDVAGRNAVAPVRSKAKRRQKAEVDFGGVTSDR